MAAGEVKAVWIIGTNPVASMPNRQRVIDALNRAELVIVQDAYHPTETSHYADILLPGALWAEAEGTMVNSERTITLMQQAVEPPGEARADWLILTLVAQHLGFGKSFPYRHAAEVFDEIRRSWNPQTGYDLRGISYERLRQQSRQWPCAPDAENGEPIRYLECADTSAPWSGATSRVVEMRRHVAALPIRFPTASGKAQFFARPCLPPAEVPDAIFPFILSNGRVAHQWHTLTKTGKVPALNKLNPGPFVEIHPDDAAALDVTEGTLVKVSSRQGFVVLPATVTALVRPGNCFAPIHWNDQFGENLAVNAATSEAVDAISLQPEFKFTAVALTRVEVALPEDFTRAQKMILQELLTQVSLHYQANGHGVPTLPETAPFTAGQRRHINELIARLCAGDSEVEKLP